MPQCIVSFVHVYDVEGKLVAQHDGPLGESGGRMLYAPFELRRQGDLIEDRHTVNLPDGLPSGQYTVAIGVYEPATVQRLVARTARGDVLPENLHALERVVVP